MSLKMFECMLICLFPHKCFLNPSLALKSSMSENVHIVLESLYKQIIGLNFLKVLNSIYVQLCFNLNLPVTHRKFGGSFLN